VSSELLLVEQRGGEDGSDSAHWILEGGRILPGVDDNRRMAELRSGLLRHPRVRAVEADADDGEVERTLRALHEPQYIEALAWASEEPVVLEEMTPPGLPPDIPVTAGLVTAAREGVRTAITAARRLAGGARFTYALCRPPGHHAGPAWCAGYCYLNTAAAAVQTLRETGAGPVAVLDLDFHYPNGTAAMIETMEDVSLFSIQAHPVTNVAGGEVDIATDREVAIEYHVIPDREQYLESVSGLVQNMKEDFGPTAAIVLSLGYDIVAGDPHGSWEFGPEIFADLGRMLAASELPICVVQEGGYALDLLAECAEAFAGGLLDDSPRLALQVPARDYPRQRGNGRIL
jgi:acetoin utilization deacetylase AcuC-like enzyme